MSRSVCHRLISPEGESLLALPKSNQKASPYCPPDPPVLALCGTRQRHTNASLSLRRVCADDASTTAQRCALRGGQKGHSNRSLIALRYELRAPSCFFAAPSRHGTIDKNALN